MSNAKHSFDDRGYFLANGSRKLYFVNPSYRDWARHKYVLQFGGNVTLCAHANSLDVALDACVDWLAAHMPGLLADSEVEEAYQDALAEGKSEEEAREIAEQDTTCAGNCGNYLHSWEWAIYAVDPTRAQLLAAVGL